MCTFRYGSSYGAAYGTDYGSYATGGSGGGASGAYSGGAQNTAHSNPNWGSQSQGYQSAGADQYAGYSTQNQPPYCN